MFKSILNSAKKSWRGKERLWKVFWLWFCVLYPASFVVGYVMIAITWALGFYAHSTDHDLFKLILAKALALLFIMLGAIIITVYPIVLCVSMYRCRHNQNTTNNVTKYCAKFFSIPFFIIHIYYSAFVVAGIVAFTIIITKF